ncbi:PREDICTED: putative uncharacterized protein DDB_G0277255, partial [Rhagoletis zephyria]|uniref:putative uncharacterized protein DDB_G0277255 n=1 Tax=Rhagoletis zephyria TaxID=28612 RepID=UPI0008118B0A
MNDERGFHHQRRPPDVEEALSSMLWRPYERNSSDSSSDEEDQKGRTKRLRKPHSYYEHRITYEPFISSYFGDDDQLEPTVAITTTPESATSTLQSIPFVPFSNFFYDNVNNDDTSGSSQCELKVFESNHKEAGIYKDRSFRFSYPYYVPIPSLNKWWSASTTSKEPPSYESLYVKDSATAVVLDTDDTSSSCQADTLTVFPDGQYDSLKCDNYKEEPTQREDFLSLNQEDSLQATGQINLELAVHFNNNVQVATHEQSIEARAGATLQWGDKMQLTNGRSQQTEKYNITNNNHGEDDDNESIEKNQLKRYHQYIQSQFTNSSQPNTMARAIATSVTGVTDSSIKGNERSEPISHEREEVSQPVPCISRSQNPFLLSYLHNSIVNNQNCSNNNNDALLNTMPVDVSCPNSGRQMNAAAINTITNLFAVAWSDKATTAERECGSRWESHFVERRTAPPVVDAVTIIQSATCSFDGRASAHHSRSSLVTLSSYSNLWKKTLSGVRSKVKRATRPSSENLRNPSVSPLDTLTPNKCLAELERLYAEFRASESALVAARNDADESSISSHCRQKWLSRSQSDSGDSACGHGCEFLNNNDTKKIIESTNNMRLNIPAAANTSLCSPPSESQAQQVHTLKVLPAGSSSSVFLTSSNCATTGCLTSNSRAKSSSDDRCKNLLQKTNNNNGDCSTNVRNQEINHDEVVDVIRNDSKSNNAMVAVLASSVIRSQPSLTIHVNSDNSDQNNNNNCTNNKNNANCNNEKNYCNDCVGGEATPLNVGAQPKNMVKGNGVSVINCNYSSVNTINKSACKLSATTAITTITTPVSSVNINKSVSQVCRVPNVLCTVRKSDSCSSIIGVSGAKNNGFVINNVNVADSVNSINSHAGSHGQEMRTQQVPNSSTTIPLIRSTPSIAVLSQTMVETPAPTSVSVVISQQPRTFTSTECQTDETLSTQMRTDRGPVSPVLNRVQRRRDRRERRLLLQQLSSSYSHQLHLPSPLRRPQDHHSMPPGPVPITGIAAMHLQSNIQHSAGSSTTTMPATISTLLRPMIPDLLQRHFPPPYSALPLNGCALTATTSPPPHPIVGLVPPPGTTLITPVISTVPMPGSAPPVANDGRFTLPLPIIR